MRRIIDDKRSMGKTPVGARPSGTTRKLTLHRDTLRELTTPDLQRIVGGVANGGMTVDRDEGVACAI